MKCYADVRVNEYIVGSGPSALTVITDIFYYGHSYVDGQGGYAAVRPDPENETEQEYLERIRLFLHRRLDGGEDNIIGREAMLFLEPSFDTRVVAWEVTRQWPLEQYNDGTVVAVHPVRDRWLRGGPDFPKYRSRIEMALPAFEQAVVDAYEALAAANGGRMGPGPDYPMRVSDAGQLSQYYTEVGAYDYSDGPPAQPLAVPSCANGRAVTDPVTNRGLVHECEALLAGKDTLRGTATLNWSANMAVADWDGVTTAGTPSRVTRVELPDQNLSGNIPPELGVLFELTHLDLSANSLTGSIPQELNQLSSLQEVRLSRNRLTGCIPVGLQGVATGDLSTLDFLYCRPPAPKNVSPAGTPGEGTVHLDWDSVPHASKYRVEYLSPGIEWTVHDEALTGTSHTVDGLDCAGPVQHSHYFRVSAYGNGTVYAEAWSEPSLRIRTHTGECTPPVFDALSYAFDVPGDARVGYVVGSVSAMPVDPEDGPITLYNTTDGNYDRLFAIDASGNITLARNFSAPTPIGTSFYFRVYAVDRRGGVGYARVVIRVTGT